MAEGQKTTRWKAFLQQATNKQDEINEIKNAPILTETARTNAASFSNAKDKVFSQFGLLAGIGNAETTSDIVHYNVAAPSSIFICGSQGSGKSHTLSCLLENCLLPSSANELPHPLTGIVFHYDTFIADNAGSPCEAAFLSTASKIRVRVLCAPTNIATITATYSRFPNVMVEELRISERNLDTKRMMDLMAIKVGSAMPLYSKYLCLPRCQCTQTMARDSSASGFLIMKGGFGNQTRGKVENSKLCTQWRTPKVGDSTSNTHTQSRRRLYSEEY